jgi:hypothetical protein
VARRQLVLIPPSEGKTAGGTGPPWRPDQGRFGDLARPRRRVVAALATAMTDDPAALLGVRGDVLTDAVRANRALRRSPTSPAIERYAGVLYRALDASSLGARARRRLEDEVVIVSGLAGVVAPGDPLPDHRVKMSASLPGLGRLSTFWRPHVDAALAPVADDAVVWDLLPAEHAAAWSGANGARRRIVVRFLDEVHRDGERRLVTVSHWNKLLKGALLRELLARRIAGPADLSDLDLPQGYRFRNELTVDDGATTTVSLVAVRR